LQGVFRFVANITAIFIFLWDCGLNLVVPADLTPSFIFVESLNLRFADYLRFFFCFGFLIGKLAIEC